MPLEVVLECLSTREHRVSIDLVRDEVETELQKVFIRESSVIETAIVYSGHLSIPGGCLKPKRGYSLAQCNQATSLLVVSGVLNAKAEEYLYTALYKRQSVKINIGIGGLHGNQFAKNSPAKIS